MNFITRIKWKILVMYVLLKKGLDNARIKAYIIISNVMETKMSALLLWFVLLLPLGLFRALICQYMWVWFVTPTTGIVAPTYGMIFGLMLFLNFVLGHMNTYKETKRDDSLAKELDQKERTDYLVGAMTHNICTNAGVWGIAYVLHYIVG